MCDFEADLVGQWPIVCKEGCMESWLIRLIPQGIDGTSAISTQSNHTVLCAYSMTAVR